MKASKTSALIAGVAWPVLALLPATAQAQTAKPAADETTTSSEASDIVVTARRSAESIQSVPVSVAAFSADSLRNRSISSTEDLQVSTPGVYLTGSGGRQNVNYTIRGQSKALAGLSSPGVVSYFAEVPDPVYGSATPQYDMASVQILKGPQGTLFGRNTTGGAVLFYPQTPTYEFGGFVEGTYGNYDDREIQGALNVPIVADKVAIRAAGDFHKRDGYTKEIGVGKDLDNINSRAYRFSLLLEPIEGIKNTTIYDYYWNHDNGQAAILSGVGAAPNLLDALGLRQAVLAQLAAQQARGPYVANNSLAQYTRVKRTSIVNRTEAEAGDVTFINIFGYRSTHFSYVTDTDGMPYITASGAGAFPAGLPIEYLTATADNNTHQLSDEIQVKGKLFDDKLTWLFGGFYLKSKPSGPQGSGVVAFQIVGTPPAASGYGFLTEQTKALFGNISYDLGALVDGLKFNAGLRYSWDKATACTGGGVSGSTQDVQPDECVVGNPKILNPSTNSTSSSAPTWTVGFDWQVNPDLFTYVVSRRGYRSGGINGPTLTGRLTPFQSFGPEKVTDVEVGVRSDWRLGGDAKLRVNVSAYSGWYDGVQAALTGLRTQPTCNPAIVNPPGVSPDGDCNTANDPAALTLLANIGKSRVAGVDLDGNLWLTRRLQINFGGSYISAKTRSIDAPAALLVYIPGGGIPFRNTPKHTYVAGISYEYPLGDGVGELHFRADFYHSDKIPYTPDFLPAYELVNARIDWNGVMGTGLDLSGFVRNLFKEKYAASGNLTTGSIAISTLTYGTPRTYGVTARYRF